MKKCYSKNKLKSNVEAVRNDGTLLKKYQPKKVMSALIKYIKYNFIIF